MALATALCLDQVSLLLPGHKQQVKFDGVRNIRITENGLSRYSARWGPYMRCDMEQFKAFEQAELK